MKVMSALYTSNGDLEILGVFKDSTIYIDGYFRNVHLLIKTREVIYHLKLGLSS